MAEVIESNKALARELVEVFGVKPEISLYWDEAKKSSVDILTARDSPHANVASFSTLGLSDHPLLDDGKDVGVRVELVGACGVAFEEFSNILSTAAFCVINSGWYACPGAIFPDVIGMYRKNSEMKHVLLTPPFLWENLKTQEFDEKTVAWLMLVPISDSEYQFARDNGSDALEDLFVNEQIDVFNLERTSVVGGLG